MARPNDALLQARFANWRELLAAKKTPPPDETPEQRKARQDAAIMRAAETGLEAATASGDPAKIKTAIEGMRAARELCGDGARGTNLPVTIQVALDTRVAVDPDDDSDEQHASH